MLTQNPVKIPDIPGKISYATIGSKEYVRYLAGRKYNAERRYNEPEWVSIGRRSERMPGMMYPNDNYEQYFTEKGEEDMDEIMTAEEKTFARNSGIYDMYNPFFEALYHEFRQQTRKRPDSLVNPYKAESLNKVLRPLKEMMAGEEYAALLGLIEICGEREENGMTYSDAMILMTQYKSALMKYHRSHG